MSNAPENLKYTKEHEWVEVRPSGVVQLKQSLKLRSPVKEKF